MTKLNAVIAFVLRLVLFIQEKGGVGKSTLARALIECLPDGAIIEIDSAHRLLEYGDRAKFFPMRTSREEIERTGGRAARMEFDAVIDTIGSLTGSAVADVGANTGAAILAALSDVAPVFADLGIEIAVVVVTTAEPGALAEVPNLLALAQPWAAQTWVVENRMRGAVEPEVLEKVAGRAPILSLDELALDDEAAALLQGGGLASIPRLDIEKLKEKYGVARAVRIRRDLTHFRLMTMKAMEPIAHWAVGE